jgi:hypothetical protein
VAFPFLFLAVKKKRSSFSLCVCRVACFCFPPFPLMMMMGYSAVMAVPNGELGQRASIQRLDRRKEEKKSQVQFLMANGGRWL